jgi:cytoskeletal protein CcmA (bactofilin family)
MTLSTRLFGEEERLVKKDRTPTTGGGGGNLNAFLGEGTSFKGILTFEGTVRIDGRLEGEIFTKDTLVIGEGAQVNAAVHAGVVVIGGTVHGNIIAERKIEIHPTGRLYGNISTPSLVIEEGVVFEGSCTMGRAAGQTGAPEPGEPVPDQERLLAR